MASKTLPTSRQGKAEICFQSTYTSCKGIRNTSTIAQEKHSQLLKVQRL